jgi:endonuclease/exonuclease/phosphatase family metal-dependent hydrolase
MRRGGGPAAVTDEAPTLAGVDRTSRRTLRVASVNTASGLDRRTWTVSVERLGHAVAGLEADVVALQEVDHLLPRTGVVDQAAIVAAACARRGPPWQHRFAATVHGTPGDRRTFRSAATTEPDEPSYGVALVTRWEVAEWHELRLPPGRARLPVPLPPGSPRRVLWAPDEQRIALAGVLATPMGQLCVICTHLSFSPSQAVRQLRRLVAWSAALPRPLVLLGDLNLPGTLPARLTGWRPLVRAATYPSSRPRLQLDHALGDGDVHVTAADTRPVAGSDHRAPVLDLLLGR